MELISSIVVPVPTDLHAIYKPTLYFTWGKWDKLSRTAAALGTPSIVASLVRLWHGPAFRKSLKATGYVKAFECS
jgi:hypothetical protein